MLSKALDQLVLVLLEVVGVVFSTASPDLIVVVIEGFDCDVLVFPGDHPVSEVQVDGGLLEVHGLHVALYLVVVIAHRNCTPPEHHVD